MSALVSIARELGREAGGLRFGPPVAVVYNPLDYAWEAHREYLRRYARPGVAALLVGINPGPWGMVQTGVPFGEVAAVRDWLGIRRRIGRPDPEHPKRLVLGLDCPRSEVSGRRLWGWARERFGTPEDFFARFFVWNWCPLAFLEASGRNRTPDKLPAGERSALEALCDEVLRQVVAALEPGQVLGLGAFATKRARAALDGQAVPIGTLLHPSPASPAANRGWAAQAEARLRALGLL